MVGEVYAHLNRELGTLNATVLKIDRDCNNLFTFCNTDCNSNRKALDKDIHKLQVTLQHCLGQIDHNINSVTKIQQTGERDRSAFKLLRECLGILNQLGVNDEHDRKAMNL
mmetsp:Transcript_71064/g.153165  ORF Transcript_71064/g.153165 Transcript_71064/m.153165 type:complete len:111 (+) Transcript_71064:467-799(+)